VPVGHDGGRSSPAVIAYGRYRFWTPTAPKHFGTVPGGQRSQLSIPSYTRILYPSGFSYQGIAITGKQPSFWPWEMPRTRPRSSGLFRFFRSNGHITRFSEIHRNTRRYTPPRPAHSVISVPAALVITGNRPAIHDSGSKQPWRVYGGWRNIEPDRRLQSRRRDRRSAVCPPMASPDTGTLKLSSLTGTWFDANLSGNPGSYLAYDVGVLGQCVRLRAGGCKHSSRRRLCSATPPRRGSMLIAIDANGNPCPGCSPVVHLVTSDSGIGYGGRARSGQRRYSVYHPGQRDLAS